MKSPPVLKESNLKDNLDIFKNSMLFQRKISLMKSPFLPSKLAVDRPGRSNSLLSEVCLIIIITEPCPCITQRFSKLIKMIFR